MKQQKQLVQKKVQNFLMENQHNLIIKIIM